MFFPSPDFQDETSTLCVRIKINNWQPNEKSIRGLSLLPKTVPDKRSGCCCLSPCWSSSFYAIKWFIVLRWCTQFLFLKMLLLLFFFFSSSLTTLLSAFNAHWQWYFEFQEIELLLCYSFSPLQNACIKHKGDLDFAIKRKVIWWCTHRAVGHVCVHINTGVSHGSS